MEAIRQTFLNRGTDCTLSSLKRIASMYKDSNMINRWTAFTNKTLGVTLNFEIVVQVIIEFIEPLVHSIEDENSLIRLEDEELANELVGAISESASELKERYCK